MSEEHPEMKVAEYAGYSDGQPGFVIVKRMYIGGGSEPVYVWPQYWTERPECAGVFETRETAERTLIGGKLH